MAEELSSRSLTLADHLLTATYPLVRDPKLLLGVLEHIATYYQRAVPYALQKQGIAPLATLRGQQEQLELPGQKLISLEFRQAIQRIGRLLEEHRASPVAFRKQEKFVICDESFGLQMLTEEKIKKELTLAKQLHKIINR